MGAVARAQPPLRALALIECALHVVGGVALAVGTGLGIVAQVETTAGRSNPAASPVQARVSSVNGMVTGAIVGWAAGGSIAVAGTTLLVVF